MAALKVSHASVMHLLCLMEIWFDQSQDAVRALSEFNYTLLPGNMAGCPFCQNWYDAHCSQAIIAGLREFGHADSCPVLSARLLRAQMLNE
jgi:hypothetical protein